MPVTHVLDWTGTGELAAFGVNDPVALACYYRFAFFFVGAVSVPAATRWERPVNPTRRPIYYPFAVTNSVGFLRSTTQFFPAGSVIIGGTPVVKVSCVSPLFPVTAVLLAVLVVPRVMPRLIEHVERAVGTVRPCSVRVNSFDHIRVEGFTGRPRVDAPHVDRAVLIPADSHPGWFPCASTNNIKRDPFAVFDTFGTVRWRGAEQCLPGICFPLGGSRCWSARGVGCQRPTAKDFALDGNDGLRNDLFPIGKPGTGLPCARLDHYRNNALTVSVGLVAAGGDEHGLCCARPPELFHRPGVF